MLRVYRVSVNVVYYTKVVEYYNENTQTNHFSICQAVYCHQDFVPPGFTVCGDIGPPDRNPQDIVQIKWSDPGDDGPGT